MNKKTILVDFDGVLHGYSKKWHDGTIYDEPKPGAAAGMHNLLDAGFKVVIYSTRCYDRVVNGVSQKNQIKEMEEWLSFHGIPYSSIHRDTEKPLCVLFIDDNAYRFLGDWTKETKDIFELVKKWIR